MHYFTLLGLDCKPVQHHWSNLYYIFFLLMHIFRHIYVSLCTHTYSVYTSAHACLFVGCLTYFGTCLLRQVYMLPHWDRSCRSNFLSYPVIACWHRANQSRRWCFNARHLAGVATGISIFNTFRTANETFSFWAWRRQRPRTRNSRSRLVLLFLRSVCWSNCP